MISYFSVLGLPQDFNIDPQELETRYLTKISACHPDLSATSTTDKMLAMTQMSIEINQAYQIIKSPLKRAIHLLEIHGIRILDDTRTIHDKELMMEQIFLREQLDSMDDKQTLEIFRARMQEAYDILVKEIGEFFSQQRLQQAGQKTIRLQYLSKLMADISHKQLSMGI